MPLNVTELACDGAQNLLQFFRFAYEAVNVARRYQVSTPQQSKPILSFPCLAKSNIHSVREFRPRISRVRLFHIRPHGCSRTHRLLYDGALSVSGPDALTKADYRQGEGKGSIFNISRHDTFTLPTINKYTRTPVFTTPSRETCHILSRTFLPFSFCILRSTTAEPVLPPIAASDGVQHISPHSPPADRAYPVPRSSPR